MNSLISKSNFQFLIASGNIQNFGTIIKISLELCELLGYSDKDMIGQYEYFSTKYIKNST